MDRFAPTYNDSDPKTGRPFSAGHPDGVWIVSILLGIPVFVSALGAIASVFMNTSALRMTLLAAVVAGMYVPPIALLFRRSRHALSWLLGLCAVDLVAIIAMAGSSGPGAPAAVALLLLHGYMAYYLFGLRRDELLR